MFGILMSVILKTGAEIDRFVKNKKSLSHPKYYLKDGTPVFNDFERNTYINGEKVEMKMSFTPDGNLYYKEVGTQSGITYIDPYKNKMDKWNEYNEEKRREAIAKGKITYSKYDAKRNTSFTCEVSTGKCLTRVEGTSDGIYRKYYLMPEQKSRFDTENEDKIGVIITQEEYDKLCCFCDVEAIDLYRNKYVVVKGKFELVPRTKEEMERLKRANSEK